MRRPGIQTIRLDCGCWQRAEIPQCVKGTKHPDLRYARLRPGLVARAAAARLDLVRADDCTAFSVGNVSWLRHFFNAIDQFLGKSHYFWISFHLGSVIQN